MLSKLQISAIRAREVLDCRGLPTVQVDVVVDDTFLGRADVPAGRSRGRHEPVELRDGGRASAATASGRRSATSGTCWLRPWPASRSCRSASSTCDKWNWTAPRTALALYEGFARDRGVVSFEDPFHEDDFAAFAELTRRLDVQVVGDDLLVTNRERVERAQLLGQCPAIQGQSGRDAVRSADRGPPGHRRGMERRRLRAVRRDRGPADRRSRRGAERRADQDRRPGARRAHRQVQPAAPDRGGTWSRGGLRRAVVPASALISRIRRWLASRIVRA